jgi:multiple sugar transport system ATP-binding protein
VSIIQIDKVRKDFANVAVLKEVSLEVRDREFCVLLGPSGCGKTTLLRIMAGLETESAGEVRIGERRVNGLPPRLRNIAMVFQNYAVFPHMTIADNIGFGLRMKKVDEATRRSQVQRCAELMHIEHLLDRYAGQLSGGQRQRVAVARALAVQPDVLLMDEPLSNLDALLRLEMRTELKALLRELGTTTIAVMHAGEIVQYAAPAQVYREPATEFVGSFIGNPPMNFLKSVDAHRALGLHAPAGAVTLGIRPEDLDLAGDDRGPGLGFDAKVVEMLGASQQITTRVGDELMRVSLGIDPPVRAGERLSVRARAGCARWYDGQGRLLATA